MSRSSQIHLPNLPRIFQADNREVDPELLEQIFSCVPKASGKVRDLLQQICGTKLRPKDKPFRQLSIKLPAADFREKWYLGRYASKRKILRPFFSIVDDWVHQQHQNLNWDSQALDQFFEKRGEKRFPRLERIEILSEQLTSAATHSVTESALYAWSLIESTQWFSLSQPNEQSLTGFRDVLLTDLRKRGASDLLAQLEDGAFLPDDTESPSSESEPLPRKFSLSKPSSSGTVKIAANPEPDSVKKLNEFYRGKIRELDTLAEQVTAEHRHATAVLKSVLSSENAVKEINDIIQSLEKLRHFVCMADGDATDLEKGIADLVAVAMQPICVDLVPVRLPRFSFATFEQWKEDVSGCVEVTMEVLRRANTLTKFDEKLIRTVMSDNQEHAIPLENAAQYLTTIGNQATVLSCGLDARQSLLRFLEAKQEDFSWNPILDANIPSECWIHVGEYLAAQGSMPRVLGICARKHYIRLKTRVAGLIDNYSTRDVIPLEKAFAILGGMTLGQIEEMKCNTEEGKTLLAAAELQSFLHAVDTAPTEAYALWSARPLSAYVSEQPSTVTERFFRAAFKASSQDGVGRLTITEFRRLIMSANSVSLSNPKQIEELLMRNLLAVLEFYPGGGQVYAQLWELAYEAICSPLKEKAEKGKLNDAAEYYSRFRSKFNIENYLSDWKSTISERLRKRSEYEKKVRLVVQGKLRELDDWLHSYESTKQLAASTPADDPVVTLKAAISEVLSAKDPGCNVLQCWFHILSKASIHRPADLITLTRTLEPNFNEESHRDNDDAFHPRVFLASTRGSAATVADFLADELFLSLGLYTPENLAKAYADQRCYEAFAALSVAASEGIPVDLERRVEAAIDDLEALYLARIEAIETKITTLDHQNAELIVNYVAEIRGWINNQQWMKADLELSDVEQTLNEFLQEAERNRLAQVLQAEIVALGGNAPAGANLQTLREARAQALAEIKPRRQHLDCLDKIVALEGLDV